MKAGAVKDKFGARSQGQETQIPVSVYVICHDFVLSLHYLKEKILSVQKQPLEVFCKKKMFLKISQCSQENTCVEVF